MSLLLVCICVTLFNNDIEANIDVDQFFQPVQRILACTAKSSYQFLSKEFTFIGCVTTCTAFYGCYALAQRFMKPTTLCALLLFGYVGYKYHIDEEIKNLFVDATNFLNTAITSTTRETHKRLHVMSEQTKKTNHALLLLEIEIKAQARQERVAMQTKFNTIEQKIQKQSDLHYLDMSQKLIDLENRLNQNFVQAAHDTQKHITQATYKLIAQNKDEIINTLQEEATRVKNRQEHLMLETRNVGKSTSLQSQETGQCINVLMHQLELTNQAIANTQNMIQTLARAVNVQVSCSSQQPFKKTEWKVPDYKPLAHNPSPERLEPYDKEDTLEQMVNVIKEQKEEAFAQQKKEIEDYYKTLQTQLSEERAARKKEFETLIQTHKTQTAKQFKKAHKEMLAQQQQVQNQIRATSSSYQPITDSPLFVRKPSLITSSLEYAKSIRTLIVLPFTSILLLLQKHIVR